MEQLRGKHISKTRFITVAGAAAGLIAFAPTSARAEEPTKEELLRQVKALQEKVERMEARQQAAESKQAEIDARVVDAAVREVREDADRRSQLLAAEGFTAGYDNGKFLIQSADGSFVLNPNAQFQFRYVANYRQDAQPDGEDDVQNGFELRRMKLNFDGNIFGKDNTYRLQWATSRSNGNLVLEEAWIRHKFAGTPFSVRGGQFADVWAHEAITSSKRQLAVDRSLLNDVLVAGGVGGENYIQGINGVYDAGGAFRAEVIFHDGFNSRNTNFTDSGGGSALLGVVNTSFGVSGRAEYKFAGDWKQYDDFTALGSKQDLIVVGGGFEWTEGDGGDFVLHTVDAQWEPQDVKGLSLYAAYVGSYRQFNDVAAGIEDKPYDWGFLAQAGYLLNEQWEVFARYDYLNLDADAPTGAGTLGAAARVEDKLHEITLGVNYYLKGHAAKFTVDGIWLPNGSPLNADGAGILAQPDDDDQFVLRAQFQLLL